MQEPPQVTVLTFDHPVYGIRPVGEKVTPLQEPVPPSSLAPMGMKPDIAGLMAPTPKVTVAPEQTVDDAVYYEHSDVNMTP